MVILNIVVIIVLAGMMRMNKIIIDSNKLLTTKIDGISFKENKLVFR